MRLALKLAFAFVLAVSVILFFYGVSRVRYGAALVVNDMRQDHRAIGNTLASTVSEVWRSNGQAHAMKLVERINREKSQIAIRWVSLSGGAARARLEPAVLQPLLQSGAVSKIVEDRERGESRMVTYVPLRGEPVEGAIELSESLAEQRAFVNNIILRTVMIAALIALVCGAISLALGYLMVGRPARRLIDMARRVGAGDFTGRLRWRKRDELGRLADEVDLMTVQLAETSAKLEGETRRRLAALEQLRHADRLKTVGQLASGIAHELGTPLQVISGRSRMLVRETLEEGEVRECGTVIVEQSERITRIVRQLLDFARRRAPSRARHDLVPLIEKTLSLLAPIAARAGASLELAKPPGPVVVEVDLAQMEQVLTNLVVNGIQSLGGSGQVRLEVTSRRLCSPEGGEEVPVTCIDVVDQGQGIPPDDLPRVFEPFFTTKDIGDGTGLGLSVSYGIMREHGGWIDVASEPGKGSRFSICLPEADVQ